MSEGENRFSEKHVIMLLVTHTRVFSLHMLVEGKKPSIIIFKSHRSVAYMRVLCYKLCILLVGGLQTSSDIPPHWAECV